MGESQFRVIVAGGGPVGLVAAHILAAAGIPFVLLEQRATIVPQQGAGIVLFPHTKRVLHQLGLMKTLHEIGEQFEAARIVNSWGWHYATSATSAWTEENHGVGWTFLHRPELLQVLYDALPDSVKPCLRAGKRLEEIEITDDDSVVVRCSDGTVEKGSILIGADGVHSQVRRRMRELALRAGAVPGQGVNAEAPFVSSYRCMYGSVAADAIPGLARGAEWDLHAAGVAMQLFPAALGGRAWFLFYQRLPRPTREARTYDEADMARVAAQVADYHVADRVRFRDVWAARRWCMLADLPEGTVDHRHWGRIVLVGDAASRQTPNLGQGWNCGVQDVVVLVNGLHKLLQGVGKGGRPATGEVEQVFEEYQGTRRPEFDSVFEAATGSTRVAAWATWSAWLNDRFIVPWFGGGRTAFRQSVGAEISRGHVLDFLPESWTPTGVVPWKHKSPCKRETIS